MKPIWIDLLSVVNRQEFNSSESSKYYRNSIYFKAVKDRTGNRLFKSVVVNRAGNAHTLVI